MDKSDFDFYEADKEMKLFYAFYQDVMKVILLLPFKNKL